MAISFWLCESLLLGNVSSKDFLVYSPKEEFRVSFSKILGWIGELTMALKGIFRVFSI
jgi:late competence protein required for DNA uptake (superfamily II DNA/RNA helicase)